MEKIKTLKVNIEITKERRDCIKNIDLIENYLHAQSIYFHNEGSGVATYNINVGFTDVENGYRFSKLINAIFDVPVETELVDEDKSRK